MNTAYIASPFRTPIGKFGGIFSSWTAADLGVEVVQEVISRANISTEAIDEVIFGNARQAGGGPNVARQIGFHSNIPVSVPAYTINQACGSGLKSILLAAQEIFLGQANVILAGGTESMSRVPYLASVRWGNKLGHQQLVDGMYQDGFLCPLSGKIMGETAETLAIQYKISRQEQDEYALRSQLRREAAELSGIFNFERITLMQKNNFKGKAIQINYDEHPRLNPKLEDFTKLSPVFSKQGTVTAGNSSGITDGAAALLVMSEDALKRHSVSPLARIVDFVTVGLDPNIMGLGPVPAIKKLLTRQNISLDQIDLIELNEAFAAQVLACDRELHFDPAKLNVNGGAIALGHPIGCSGTRIVVTLVHELNRRKAKLGLATLCISGGLGIALLVERVTA